MRLILPAAAIVATGLCLATTALPAAALGRGGTMFDLGIDTSQVPIDRADVSAYLANLEPEATSVILSSCSHYLTTPLAARSQDTLDFCRVALGAVASGNVRTFATVDPISPQITLPSLAPAQSSNSDPLSWGKCQFPHYTVNPNSPCY